MSQELPPFEDTCRIVGRLFLKSQYDLDRLLSIQARQSEMISSLQGELRTCQRKLAEQEGTKP